jgi:hypothetical protein
MMLTYLWWIWGLGLIVLFTIISAVGSVFEKSEGLEWLLPNIMPTMTLVGAASYTQRQAPQVDQRARRPLYHLALIVSTAYLLMLSASVPMLAYSSDPVGLLLKWNLGLGPLQGLCASVLGVFFLKKE